MGEEIGEGLLLPSRSWASPNPCPWTKSSPSLCSSAQDMLLLPLSMLLLLTQSQSSLGEEMDVYSEKTLTDPCTLVVCAPPADSLHGRDGRDGREGPRGEKGDQGPPGMPGADGREAPSGRQGSMGPPGPKGEPGPKVGGWYVAGGVGAPGMQGSPGPTGLKGERGAPGPAGAVGPQGPSGARGPPGLEGDRGTPGEKGAKGETSVPEVATLRQQMTNLEGVVQRLRNTVSQYRKAVLFPDGLAVGEKIFKTSGAVKSYSDARQVCREAEGQLASPRSAAENEAVTKLVRARNKHAYLSMNDISREGRFTYPTGQSLVYSNWAPGEPNNRAKDGGPEDCLEIYSNGNWNDIECTEERLVICEF
ncbi:collectin-43-like [Oryx dammah]|uniref:collectin-43-like n=1 Tax=Oryx dammah TaxID=59534 RepID=UPI001A9B9689|nr:collectin-43-like [Oryx dammah]